MTRPSCSCKRWKSCLIFLTSLTTKETTDGTLCLNQRHVLSDFEDGHLDYILTYHGNIVHSEVCSSSWATQTEHGLHLWWMSSWEWNQAQGPDSMPRVWLSNHVQKEDQAMSVTSETTLKKTTKWLFICQKQWLSSMLVRQTVSFVWWRMNYVPMTMSLNMVFFWLLLKLSNSGIMSITSCFIEEKH